MYELRVVVGCQPASLLAACVVALLALLYHLVWGFMGRVAVSVWTWDSGQLLASALHAPNLRGSCRVHSSGPTLTPCPSALSSPQITTWSCRQGTSRSWTPARRTRGCTSAPPTTLWRRKWRPQAPATGCACAVRGGSRGWGRERLVGHPGLGGGRSLLQPASLCMWPSGLSRVREWPRSLVVSAPCEGRRLTSAFWELSSAVVLSEEGDGLGCVFWGRTNDRSVCACVRPPGVLCIPLSALQKRPASLGTVPGGPCHSPFLWERRLPWLSESCAAGTFPGSRVFSRVTSYVELEFRIGTSGRFTMKLMKQNFNGSLLT